MRKINKNNLDDTLSNCVDSYCRLVKLAIKIREDMPGLTDQESFDFAKNKIEKNLATIIKVPLT